MRCCGQYQEALKRKKAMVNVIAKPASRFFQRGGGVRLVAALTRPRACLRRLWACERGLRCPSPPLSPNSMSRAVTSAAAGIMGAYWDPAGELPVAGCMRTGPRIGETGPTKPPCTAAVVRPLTQHTLSPRAELSRNDRVCTDRIQLAIGCFACVLVLQNMVQVLQLYTPTLLDFTRTPQVYKPRRPLPFVSTAILPIAIFVAPKLPLLMPSLLCT